MSTKLKRVFRVPIVGWLCGVVAVLVLVLWYQIKRARLLAARLRVEAELRAVRKSHETLIKEHLEGNIRRNSNTGSELAKMERERLHVIKSLKHKAKNLEGLSDAFNDVFK